jgi:hypothetical protein
MRTLRLGSVLATTAFLVASVTAGAAAQSDACTGILEFGAEPESGAMTWAASDPRLSGDAEADGGWSLYAPPSEDTGTGLAASYVITNDGGVWNCVASRPGGPEPDIDGHTLVFQGSGGYEGLTAHVQIDWDSYPFVFSGLILEGGPEPNPVLPG